MPRARPTEAARAVASTAVATMIGNTDYVGAAWLAAHQAGTAGP